MKIFIYFLLVNLTTGETSHYEDRTAFETLEQCEAALDKLPKPQVEGHHVVMVCIEKPEDE